MDSHRLELDDFLGRDSTTLFSMFPSSFVVDIIPMGHGLAALSLMVILAVLFTIVSATSLRGRSTANLTAMVDSFYEAKPRPSFPARY